MHKIRKHYAAKCRRLQKAKKTRVIRRIEQKERRFKAQLAGVPVEKVPAPYTTKSCPRCEASAASSCNG